MRKGSPDSDRSSRSSGSSNPHDGSQASTVQSIPNPLFEAHDRRNPLGRAFALEMASLGKDRGSSGSESLSTGEYQGAEDVKEASPTLAEGDEAHAMRELMNEPFGQRLKHVDLTADVLISHGWRLRDVQVLKRWFEVHSSWQHTFSEDNMSSFVDRLVMWLFGLREGSVLYDDPTLLRQPHCRGDRVFLRGSGIPIQSEKARRRMIRIELFRASYWTGLMTLIHVGYIASAVRQFAYVGSTNVGVLLQTYSNSEKATLITALHAAFRNTAAVLGASFGVTSLPLAYGLLQTALYAEQYVRAPSDRVRSMMTRLHLPTSFPLWRRWLRYWFPMNPRAVSLNALNRMLLYSWMDPEQRNHLTSHLSSLMDKAGGHEATLMLDLMASVAAMSPEDMLTLLNGVQVSLDQRESILRAPVQFLQGLMETADASPSRWKREGARRAMGRIGALDLSRRDHQLRFGVYNLQRALLLAFAGINLFELGRVVVDVVRCPRANHETTPLGTLPYGVSFGMDCFRNMMALYGLIPNQPAGPVADMIRRTHFSQHVTSLKLPGKLVSAQGAADLLNAFADRGQLMQAVDLSDNDFRDPAAIGAFHRALQRHPVVVLTLAQTGDMVPRSQAASLALVACARGVPTLREWRLGGVTGNATVVEALSDTLRGTDLRVLHVSNSTAGFGTVGNTTANAFGEALAQNRGLTEVALEAWTVMDAGNSMVWGLERAVPHLPALSRFSLSGNNFGSTRHKPPGQASEDWATLGRMFPHMQQLHTLDVSWNVNEGFSPPVAGPEFFLAGLATVVALEELYLNGNILPPASFGPLATTLPHLAHLRVLNMGYMGIGLFPEQTAGAVHAIFTGLHEHPRLAQFIFWGNVIGLAPYNGTLVCESLGSLGASLQALDVSLNALFNPLPAADLPSCFKGELYRRLCAQGVSFEALNLRENLIGAGADDWANITEALSACRGMKRVTFQSQSQSQNRFRLGDVRDVETYLLQSGVESEGARPTFATSEEVAGYFDLLPSETSSVSFKGTINNAAALVAVWTKLAERHGVLGFTLESSALMQITAFSDLRKCSQLTTVRLIMDQPEGEVFRRNQNNTVESSVQIIDALAVMPNATDVELLLWPSLFPIERIEPLAEKLAQALEVLCPSLRSLVLYNFATSGPSFERVAMALNRCVHLRKLGLPYSSFPRNATHMSPFLRAVRGMEELEELDLSHTPIGAVPGATEALVELVHDDLPALRSAVFDGASVGQHGPSAPTALLKLAGERPGFRLSAKGGSWEGIDWEGVAAPVVVQREGARVEGACRQSLCYEAAIPSPNTTGSTGLQFSAVPHHPSMEWAKAERTAVTVAGVGAGGLLAVTVGVAAVVTRYRRRQKQAQRQVRRGREVLGSCSRRLSFCERLSVSLSQQLSSCARWFSASAAPSVTSAELGSHAVSTRPASTIRVEGSVCKNPGPSTLHV